MAERPAIEDLLAAAVAEHVPMSVDEVRALISVPPAADMGDYALPCFPLARALRKAPNAIAAELQTLVRLPDGIVASRAVGPYLNFSADRAGQTACILAAICRAGRLYGAAEVGAGRTVVFEYSSPNIAKHLGVHHLPGTIIGRTLCRIFERLGYTVVAVNFLGDWGTGFGKLIAAVERYGVDDVASLTVDDLQGLYVRYSREAEEDPALTEAARAAALRLERGEKRAVHCWETFRAVSLAEFEHAYERLGVAFDRYTPESEYRGRMAETLRSMQEAGVAVESEGALIVRFDAEEMPPLLVRTGDGRSLYATRDIPAAIDRWETYRFDRSVYVVGNEQSLYLNQVRAALRRMGHEWADRVVHVNFGLIKFLDAETGQARKGSTRRGELLLLEEVLDEAVARARVKIAQNADRFEEGADLDALAEQVGIGAVLFRQMSVRRTRDVVFDWDRMLDFEGDTGPYVQYAHARLCSILRKAGGEVPEQVDFGLLCMPEEWTLVRHLERFPRTILRAAREYEPSVIATHLLELCADFSSYYSAGMKEPDRRVLCEDERVRAARLKLVDAVRHVIRSGLELLGIAVPERM
ncbi:MAG: arginine--tRNA ligase [Candidatus Brocadiaceae bacterium]|nr:arginine--tRNA ligase [Candidatus Brocadiaceae bacterium]